MVWSNEREIGYRLIQSNGAAYRPVVLAIGAAENAPGIAWSGDGHGVAWRSNRSTPSDPLTQETFFARTSSLGVELGQEVAISSRRRGSCTCTNTPAQGMAWNGVEYGVFHADTTGLLAFTRVNAAGLALGTTAYATTAGTVTSAAWTGSAWVVAHGPGARLSAVSASGAEFATIAVSTTGTSPRVIAARGEAVVVWNETRIGGNEVVGRRYVVCGP